LLKRIQKVSEAMQQHYETQTKNELNCAWWNEMVVCEC